MAAVKAREEEEGEWEKTEKDKEECPIGQDWKKMLDHNAELYDRR